MRAALVTRGYHDVAAGELPAAAFSGRGEIPHRR